MSKRSTHFANAFLSFFGFSVFLFYLFTVSSFSTTTRHAVSFFLIHKFPVLPFQPLVTPHTPPRYQPAPPITQSSLKTTHIVVKLKLQLIRVIVIVVLVLCGSGVVRRIAWRRGRPQSLGMTRRLGRLGRPCSRRLGRGCRHMCGGGRECRCEDGARRNGDRDGCRNRCSGGSTGQHLRG